MSVTLSISATKYENNRLHFCQTIVVYLITAFLAVFIHWIYSLFSHGVSSPAMTWMFLYPLLGGVLCFTVLGFALCRVYCLPGYRLFFNAYNSGIATLTISSFLKGVFDIAGTESVYLGALYVAGWVFLFIAAIALFKKSHADKQF